MEPKVEEGNPNLPTVTEITRAKLRAEPRPSKKSRKQNSCPRNAGFCDMDGRLWQVVLKMETTAGAPKHISRNFYPSPPRPRNPVLVRHQGAGSYLTVGPAPVPSSLWALGFPTCKTTRLDIEPQRALPTRKCQVRVSGPFPPAPGLCAPFVPQPGCWLIRDVCFVPQLRSNSPGSWVGVWGEPEDRARPGTSIPSLILSPLALPHILSPGPEEGDSQGGSESRNQAAGAISPAKNKRQHMEGAGGSHPSSWNKQAWADETPCTLPRGFKSYFLQICNATNRLLPFKYILRCCVGLGYC